MEPSVVLASMPWAPVQEPSLALGLLGATLRAHDVRTRVMHLNTLLLEHVTYDTYVDLAGYWGLDEFVFTELLSPGLDDAQVEALAERCTAMRRTVDPGQRYPAPSDLLDMLLRFRGEVALDYLEQCADRVLAQRPTMLGLTCMFDQTLASVALARIVKDRSPQTLVVLGGYALEGPPGEQVLESFGWVDAVVRGDGENVVVPLAHASAGRRAPAGIPGVQVRGEPAVQAQPVNLADGPDPDYDDWFDDVARLQRETGIRVVTGALPVESSRGCWWGQRKHCVFCGIDEETLKFRHKPAARTLDMLAAMRSRYGEHPLRFSDYIMPREYFGDLLPQLEQVRPPYRLHCEIKANQTDDSVADLARAGFEEVQPGIESFSDEVLKLMDKGVTAVQNVALLRYGYIHGVLVHYNLIYGIPGESAGAYRQMLERIPRLYHLMPPVSRTEAIVTRFAPMHTTPHRFGWLSTPRHHRCYDVLFGADFLETTKFDLDDYAYYFEPYEDFASEMKELYAQVVLQVNHWKRLHRERVVVFTYADDGERVVLEDSRFHAEPATSVLDGLAREVYLACTRGPTNLERLATALVDGGRCTRAELDAVVARLDDARAVWWDGRMLLALAVPRDVCDAHVANGWRQRWTAVYK